MVADAAAVAVPVGSLLLHPADVVDVEVVLVTRVTTTTATHGCRNIRTPLMFERKIDFCIVRFLFIFLLLIESHMQATNFKMRFCPAIQIEHGFCKMTLVYKFTLIVGKTFIFSP